MFNHSYRNIIYKVVNQLLEIKKIKKNLFCLLSGAQGSGKSTFANLIKKKLVKKKLKILVLSIDDFYYSKKDRLKLSKSVSPLLITRGVPGTHDLASLQKVLKLFQQNKKIEYKLPLFSKAEDDLLNTKFHLLKFPYDIFILEGWCVNYKGEKINSLKKPINQLEKLFDQSLNWRKYVNIKSKEYFKKIYNKSDCSILLKIPSFQYVFKFRKKQETTIPKKKQMSNQQLKKFISFYERITKNLLVSKKNNFDIQITVKKNHNYSSFKKNIF